MLTTLDRYGSITLPASIREKLGLDEESYFEISIEGDGDIVLHPIEVQRNIRLNEKGLKKLEEARISGTCEIPEWLIKDMENAKTDSE